MEPTSLLAWADVMHADFQKVICCHIQNISTVFPVKLIEGYELYLYKNPSRNIYIYLAKSSQFKSTDFASVMFADVISVPSVNESSFGLIFIKFGQL